MIKATFETSNCVFEVYAPSEKAAFRLLERGWARHATETGADPNWIYENKEDVCYIEVDCGVILRDGEVLEKVAEW